MSPVFARGSKSQAEQIQLLLDHGWKEDQSRDDSKNGRTNLYLWRWRQPKTGALFTLKDAVEFIESQRITTVTRKIR